MTTTTTARAPRRRAARSPPCPRTTRRTASRATAPRLTPTPAAGELATKTAGTQTTTYTYDAFGHLLHASVSGISIDYIVDGENRRVGRKLSGRLNMGFLYERGRVVAQLSSVNGVAAWFVYGDRHVPEYMVKGGVTYRLVTDHLGSVRLVVNTSDGSVAQQIDYDEWGVVLSDSSSGFQPFGFAGGLYDVSTKLVRFGARDYDANTGRWTAKDPILFGGGQGNLYVYVGNDPIQRVDSRGTGPTACWLAIASCSGYSAYQAYSSWTALNDIENQILDLRMREAELSREIDATLQGATCPGMSQDPTADLKLLQQEEARLLGEYARGQEQYTGILPGLVCDAIVAAACFVPGP